MLSVSLPPCHFLPHTLVHSWSQDTHHVLLSALPWYGQIISNIFMFTVQQIHDTWNIFCFKKMTALCFPKGTQGQHPPDQWPHNHWQTLPRLSDWCRYTAPQLTTTLSRPLSVHLLLRRRTKLGPEKMIINSQSHSHWLFHWASRERNSLLWLQNDTRMTKIWPLHYGARQWDNMTEREAASSSTESMTARHIL